MNYLNKGERGGERSEDWFPHYFEDSTWLTTFSPIVGQLPIFCLLKPYI